MIASANGNRTTDHSDRIAHSSNPAAFNSGRTPHGFNFVDRTTDRSNRPALGSDCTAHGSNRAALGSNPTAADRLDRTTHGSNLNTLLHNDRCSTMKPKCLGIIQIATSHDINT
jgi:hypothetical protein